MTAKKRNYGSGTIVADPADSKAFIGYLRRTIDGKRYKSPVFHGPKKRDVEIQLKATLKIRGWRARIGRVGR